MARFIAIVSLVAVLSKAAWAAAPKVGDKAPDFKLQASDGKEYSLADFAGKKPVVIAWFPKAFTRGCTAECKNMKEDGEAIRAYDVAYFAASVDKNEDNTKFAESLSLDFPILSDPSKQTANAYGVINPERGMANRWTFYIGADGKIQAIDQQVKPAQHAKDIAARLEELGVKKK
jgi:thioredoxin-dependent peroxiredoxin